ncbi:hypothetical protein BC828DRAFT_411555 [Blastocladiella britannica]|nr:hypothetical protein BC828DRAFT_411555 [Blastocladiella britannica]
MSPRHRILRDLPFVLPFEDRVALFREFVALDRSVTLGPNAEWRNLMVGERQRLEVRRDAVFEDGYAQITRLPTDSFKSRLAITFVSELGTTEAGIDGGGVFKEFFTLLARDAFDPNRGLFRATPHEQAMFPNPRAILDTRGLPPLGESSRAVVNAALAHQYDFVGRVVGKALYDGILVDVAFAPFFLNHWLGRRNLLEDLPSYDPQLARSLLSLSGFTSKDMHELGLTFSVDAEGGGIVDLIRDGRNVPVTSSNRIKYSYLLANFKLNAEIHRACSGFLSGMHQLIRPEWLRLFNQVELSNLVSGSQTSIDLDDMRLHATYGGEYNERHPVIGTFWAVVESFTDEDRRLLVRFITSCTRAPLLGFKELVPAMCIRPGGDDQEWLPTASTCVNLLKLPKYASADTLREKLLYSIRSGVGFELS